MLSNILYYIIYTSSVLIYGIGINRAVVYSENPDHLLIKGIKLVLTVEATSVLSFLVTRSLLIPANVTEMYPFVAVLIYTAIAVFIEAIIRITARISTAEFGISFMYVILALNESTTIAECSINSVIFSASFFLLIPVLYAINRRIQISRHTKDVENQSLLFISIALIMIILLVWNVTWLNPGVFK